MAAGATRSDAGNATRVAVQFDAAAVGADVAGFYELYLRCQRVAVQ
jgi:hypothetical protein